MASFYPFLCSMRMGEMFFVCAVFIGISLLAACCLLPLPPFFTSLYSAFVVSREYVRVCKSVNEKENECV